MNSDRRTEALDQLYRLTLLLALSLAAAGCVPGMYVILQDLQVSGEFLDGVGVVLGLALLVPAVVPGLLALRALQLLRRPERAWRWGLASGVTGVLSVAVLSLTGIYVAAVMVTVVVPLLVLVVAWASRPTAGSRTADRFGA